VSVDSSNWTDWLGKYGPQLLLFARTRTRSEADAEDLLQEAVVESAGKNEGNPPDLPLVYATIRRRAIDLARKTDRRIAREEVSAEESGTCWFDDTIEQKETALLIDLAMKKMLEKFREVVILKIWSELTFAQIAEALEIPLNTAASRYRYGLEILKRDANLKKS
jgi:RNA polymerase sigma-70 factor (ECF subfamily)